MCPVVRPSDQDGCTAELSSTQDPMGNSHKNHLVWNQQLNQNQTLMEQSLDDPFPKLCPAVTLSHQDGRHSAVALLLKAALIQVSDYRLLGASGFLKPQNRFEPNLAEMFIGWSYTRFVFLALIGNPTWLPGPIMCSDWSNFLNLLVRNHQTN